MTAGAPAAHGGAPSARDLRRLADPVRSRSLVSSLLTTLPATARNDSTPTVPSRVLSSTTEADDPVLAARDAAAREIRALDALLAASDGAGPPVCAAFLRAWFEVASLDWA